MDISEIRKVLAGLCLATLASAACLALVTSCSS